MTTILLQPLGSLLAVAFQNDNKNEIFYQYWSFLNLGYTTGSLTWIRDDFAYILLTKEKFNCWLKKSSIRIFENEIDDEFDKKNENHCRRVNQIIGKRFLNIRHEHFVYWSSGSGGTIYNWNEQKAL